MDEFKDIPEEKVKTMFFNAIKSLEMIPHHEELLLSLPQEKQQKLRTECRQFENEFHERVYQLLFPELSIESIRKFIESMTPYGDIPSNFKELMLLSPENPNNYVETQRVGEKNAFSNSNNEVIVAVTDSDQEHVNTIFIFLSNSDTFTVTVTKQDEEDVTDESVARYLRITSKGNTRELLEPIVDGFNRLYYGSMHIHE